MYVARKSLKGFYELTITCVNRHLITYISCMLDKKRLRLIDCIIMMQLLSVHDSSNFYSIFMHPVFNLFKNL